MPDKKPSFEEQARAQLEHIDMEPRAAVWEGVSAALQKEKKRRWLIWLLIGVLCCGGGAAWWMVRSEGGVVRRETSVVSGREEKRVSSSGEKKIVSDRESSVVSDRESSVVSDRESSVVSDREQMVVNDTGVTGSGNANRRSEKVVVSHEMSVVSDTLPSVEHSVLSVAHDTLSIQHSTFNIAHDTLSIQPSALNIAHDTVSVLVKKHSKWEWRILGNAGVSGMRGGIIRFSPAPVYANPSAFYSNAPGGSGSAAIYAPPVSTDAFSYSLGVEAMKHIGRKHGLGFSIGYSLYQNRLNVGAKVDSARQFNTNGSQYAAEKDAYFRNTDSGSYTNRYHFIEASVNWYTDFRLFRTVPMRWQAGTGLGLLAASNALHYAPADNVLFRNRSLLRTLQVQVSAGLDIGIGKQPVWYIGPQLRFFVSNLSKQQGVKQYAFQSSLKVTYTLPKKKK